jgi:hypothetical protein
VTIAKGEPNDTLALSCVSFIVGAIILARRG